MRYALSFRDRSRRRLPCDRSRRPWPCHTAVSTRKHVETYGLDVDAEVAEVVGTVAFGQGSYGGVLPAAVMHGCQHPLRQGARRPRSDP